MDSKTISLLFLACALSGVVSISSNIAKDCGENEKCVDLELTSIIDKFDEEEKFNLYSGLNIIRTGEREPVNISRKTSETLLERIGRFIRTHEFSFDIHESNGRSFLEDARSSKLKKLMLPLLLALKLKMMIVLPVILSAVTLISIKGVFAGLIAILISGMTALKSAVESKHGRVTTIVASPVPEMIHSHDYRWGRVGQEASETPQTNQPSPIYQSLGAFQPSGGVYQASIPYQASAESYTSPYLTYQNSGSQPNLPQ